MTPTLTITETVTLTYPGGEVVPMPLWQAEAELDYLENVQRA